MAGDAAAGSEDPHNVVIYYDAQMRIEAGVEVFSPFTPTEDVEPSATPFGEMITTTHFGEYSDVFGAYDALGRWCRANGRQTRWPNWEVYGDWSDDPRERQMDVFQLLKYHLPAACTVSSYTGSRNWLRMSCQQSAISRAC